MSTPKVLVVSLRVDWENERVTDSVMTFTEDADALKANLPDYKHFTYANDAALIEQLKALREKLT